MPPFRIICRNHARESGITRWSPDKANRVAIELTSLFERVTEGTDFQPIASVSEGSPGANGLVIHFLGSKGSSIINNLTGQLPQTAAGATFPVSLGMISEVYIANISVVTRAIANLAFHELMHNKLDAQANPEDRVVQDIHTDGGGGLAIGTPINETTPLTERNIELMRGALAREIPQYTR